MDKSSVRDGALVAVAGAVVSAVIVAGALAIVMLTTPSGCRDLCDGTVWAWSPVSCECAR